MKTVHFLICIVLFVSCLNDETQLNEVPIKFTTNITSGKVILTDSLEAQVFLSSKMPAGGIIISAQLTRKASDQIVYKLDTLIQESNLSFLISGLNIKGDYVLSLTIKSKLIPTNYFTSDLKISRGSANKNYLRSSYELSNFESWFSSFQLYQADGSRYLNNPFIDEQSAQLDINLDGLEDVFYFEAYDLNIAPTPNPPPSIFMNDGVNLKQTTYKGPDIKYPHGTKLLVGDFNKDFFPDIFSNVAIDPPTGTANLFKDANHLILNSDIGFAKVIEFPGGGFWYTGCSGDIDKDGDLDIITFNFHYQANGNKSRIMWNDGKAGFTVDYNGIGEIPVVYQSELFDVDNDGFLDLVIVFVPNSSTRKNDFRVLWGNGSGFSLANSTKIDIPGDWILSNLDFTDIDLDGTFEILPSGSYYLSTSNIYFITLFKSEDKGKTFLDQTSKFIDNNTTQVRFGQIRVQDIDQNGRTDVFSTERKDNVRWEWNGSKFLKRF